MQNNQVKKDVDVSRNVPHWLSTYSTWSNVVNHTDVIRTTGLQFTGHLSHRGRRQRASPLRYVFVNLKSGIDLEFDFVSNLWDPSRKKHLEK